VILIKLSGMGSTFSFLTSALCWLNRLILSSKQLMPGKKESKTPAAISFFANAQYGEGQENPSKGQINANKGQYNEDNSVQRHPYTIFVKSSDFSIINEIERLRKMVVKDALNENFGDKYGDIFISGSKSFNNQNKDSIGGHPLSGTSPSSLCCKNAAFVYLMGFYKDGKLNFLRTGDQDSTVFKGSIEHNAFKTRAIQRLQWMNVKTVTSVDLMQWRSKEIIHYLQAYDMLKTAEMLADQGVPGYSFTQTEKEQLVIIKYNLQLFTRNIYRGRNINAKINQNY